MRSLQPGLAPAAIAASAFAMQARAVTAGGVLFKPLLATWRRS
jgi:hypothetical protein